MLNNPQFYRRLSAVLGFAVLIEAVILALALRTVHPDPVSLTPAPEPFRDAALLRNNVRLRAEIAQLRTEMSLMAASAEAGSRAAPGFPVMTLADFKRRGLAQVGLSILDSDGELSSGFVELFGLSPVEQAELRRAVNEARNACDALTAANATLTRKEDGSVEVSVAPFPEQGAGLYDQLFRSFEQTLGPERHAALSVLAGSQVEEAFELFGAQARSVAVSKAVREDGGNTFFVSERQEMGTERRSRTADFTSFARFEKRYRSIAKLLSADLKEPE